APPPSGALDPGLRAAMLAQATAATFRLRVNAWSLLWRWRRFPWREFESRLADAEYRRYAGWNEMLQSIGWAGRAATGADWLFGVAGYGAPLYGASAMRHELFHAA